MQKTALITGITGQDGSYLAELLLQKGYKVYGLIRRTSTEKLERIQHIQNQIHLVKGDLTDQTSLTHAIENSNPDEIYNLAAQSFVPTSFEQPELTMNITGTGVLRLIEAVRQVNPRIKIYQASSSEMFGQVTESPQNEQTPFHPRSPYGCAKAYAYYICQNYREAYGMYICNGILFNHESPRRGLEFVTRKITNTIMHIHKAQQNKLIDQQDKLTLGNIEAQRDWGHAKDYVEAMWLMLQQPKPDDYVIATGESHTVKEFVQEAFNTLGIYNYEDYIQIDKKLYRPTEVHTLRGDYTKAKNKLGWQPKTTFKTLIKEMMEEEFKKNSKEPK